MPLTLSVERPEPLGPVMLVADDGRKQLPLATFHSEDAARLFVEAFVAARAVSHAQGQMGI